MCGLAAIMAISGAVGPVGPSELDAMGNAMRNRGPDGGGSWISPDGRLGLAHRRLAIIDLSPDGAQPMASACGRLRIVFNGEIYNYRELRDELAATGVVFRSHSDTEVLIEMYRRHGIAMLERLRGMFAFVLWDEDKRGLLVARDHFGIKPLYLSEGGGCVRLASQVKALLAGGGIDTTPDMAGRAGFLLWGHVPEPFTLYRGIRAVPAGGWLWFGADGSRRQGVFFDMAAEMRNPPPPTIGLSQALADSIRHHLIADVPVGVFLSSGLDSTTIAALAARQVSTPLRTLTLGFAEYAGTPLDEVPLAEIVAAGLGADHHTDRIAAADFAGNRDTILTDMDQPSVDGVNTWFVSRAAAARGLKVALSGLGGDELFAGYAAFQQIPRLVRMLSPLRRLPGLGRAVRVVAAPILAGRAPAKAAGILELGSRYGDAYLLRRGLFMPWELPKLMGAEQARAGWAELAPRLALNGLADGVPTPRLKVSALETAFYMRNQLLRDSDWAGMAHSLEIRVPLVDITLWRSVVGLIGGGQPPGKLDMAAAAAPDLPPSILNRPKTGFFVPVAQWLGMKHLRGWAHYLLSHSG